MVVFVLLIAVLNLGLGYAVAAHLGRRYRALLAHELSCGSPVALASDGGDTSLAGERLPAIVEPNDTELDDDARTALIDGLLEETAEYKAMLDEANRIGASQARQLDPSQRGQWIGRLSEGTDAYLDRRNAREADLRSLLKSEGLDARFDSFNLAWQQQGTQLQQVSDTAGRMVADPEAEEHWEPLGRQIDDLLASTSNVGTLLGEARTALRADRGLAGQPADASAATGGLEAVLARWSATAPQPDVLPCAVLIDVDHMEQLNQRYGGTLADQMLEALYELSRAEQRHGAMVDRIDGQRFVLMFSDPDTQRAANIVERLRQTIAKTRFVCGDREIQASVSCAVAGPTPGEGIASLFDRATAALAEAKQYGRDRTFLHRGDFPAPVAPPSLTLDETRTLLNADTPAHEAAAAGHDD